MLKTAFRTDAAQTTQGGDHSETLWATLARRDAVRGEPRGVLTGGQIRAARALLQWTAEALAAHAQVGVATIRRAERTDGPVRCLASINLAVRRTFEAAGVEFTSENGLTGVRIRLGVGV